MPEEIVAEDFRINCYNEFWLDLFLIRSPVVISFPELLTFFYVHFTYVLLARWKLLSVVARKFTNL